MASKSSNKARKRTEDKLDWEALETAPNVEGMLSYLRTPSPMVVPFPARANSDDVVSNVDASLPSESLGSVVQGSSSVPQSPVEFPDKPNPDDSSQIMSNLLPRKPLGSELLPSQRPGPPHTDQPLPRLTSTTDVPGFGKRRYHRCVFVQEAHTPGEQAVLSGLYRLGKNPRFGHVLPDGSMRVCVSLVELGRQIAMHETNVRVNVRNLINKLAIEQVRAENKKQQSAREYRVYTFKQILERRRAAGLEWVVKGRGVQFVSTADVLKALPSASLPSDYLFDNETLASEAQGRLDGESLESRGSETLGPFYIGNTLGISATNTASTVVDRRLIDLLRSNNIHPDDEILQRMIQTCRTTAEQETGTTATTDEILYFVEQKLRAIQRMSNVRNAMALLSTIVPKCFEGVSFRAYRETEQRRQALQEAEAYKQQEEFAALLEAQKRILDDPQASHDDKTLAKKILGLE
jgi:hypothetical protein